MNPTFEKWICVVTACKWSQTWFYSSWWCALRVRQFHSFFGLRFKETSALYSHPKRGGISDGFVRLYELYVFVLVWQLFLVQILFCEFDVWFELACTQKTKVPFCYEMSRQWFMFDLWKTFFDVKRTFQPERTPKYARTHPIMPPTALSPVQDFHWGVLHALHWNIWIAETIE